MKNFKQYLLEMTKHEKQIYQDPDMAYGYARIREKRFVEAEPYIMNEPEIAVLYARNVIKGRWPEAEPIIMRSEFAFDYANDVIQSRWPEAEPYIMKQPQFAVQYADEIMRDRWPDAEPWIMNDPEQFDIYVNDCNNIAKQDVYQHLISLNPENIKHFDDPDKANQELAVKLGGKKILILIKDPDPKLLERYPEIANLKKSGLFK